MEGVQAILAAATGDTIVGSLYRVHTQDRTLIREPSVEFEPNEAFNDYVDGMYELIHIFESEFRASEVLFRLEPETYRIYMTEFESLDDEVVEVTP